MYETIKCDMNLIIWKKKASCVELIVWIITDKNGDQKLQRAFFSFVYLV